MSELMKFEEYEFYSDSEAQENFEEFLSDVEETQEFDECLNSDNEDEEVDSQEEIQLDDTLQEKPKEDVSADSLLDSLLGNALSDNYSFDSNVKTDDIFSDLGTIEESVMEPEPVNDTESPVFHPKHDIEKYMQFLREEELAIPIDDVPDYATEKNVYGTCFNIQTGTIIRPPKIEYAKRSTAWIDSFRDMISKCSSVKKLLHRSKEIVPIEYGTQLEMVSSDQIVVHTKTNQEMKSMETRDIQNIICNSFNDQKLAVILLGVNADNGITGCQMTCEEQDNLRLALDTAIQTEFDPPVENILDAIDMKYIPVENGPFDNSYLVVIRVKQLRNQKYQLHNNRKY